eukprot:m.235523 g.235523  ORF g.235523 m.235523 type:complete len:251 (-) comp12841_c0_seq1:130-882(-)
MTIDLSKPMLAQVGQLGRDYRAWVYRPSAQGSYRLFESDLLETFSKTPWFVVPLVWLPFIGLMSYLSLHCNENSGPISGICAHVALGSSHMSPALFAFVFMAGVLGWTLLEFILHRHLFHLILHDTPFWITAHFFLHGQHHKFPRDQYRLVFPPVAASVLAYLIYAAVQLVFPLTIARGVMAGIALGYVSYDLTHYYLHHQKPSLAYLQRLRTSHINHHYRDASKGFGISCKLWDIAFDSQSAERVTEPE